MATNDPAVMTGPIRFNADRYVESGSAGLSVLTGRYRDRSGRGATSRSEASFVGGNWGLSGVPGRAWVSGRLRTS